MIIYKITNTINNKIYIGQTVGTLEKRWNNHKYNKQNTAISNAIRKYGSENFKIEEIDGANSLSELNYLEEHYIHIYNTLSPNGYNLLKGGKNKTFSEIIKQKMRKPKRPGTSEACRIRLGNRKIALGSKRTPEQRKAISEKQMGRIAWNKGKKYTEEDKIKYKIKNRKKPIPFSEEHRRKLGEATRRRFNKLKQTQNT